MRALVTGAAGFIGSHLVEALLAQGHAVVGLDAFTETYPTVRKRANLAAALYHPSFGLLEADLLDGDLLPALRGCDVVFHLAGQPGVRESWGSEFAQYAERNVVATERLLDAARRAGVGRVVFASSSSVYGAAPGLLLNEAEAPRPISPYGVTKLAAEELCLAYQRSFGLPVVVLRYFTAYGPRQRPDMAFSRFIAAIEEDRAVSVYGDGQQRRDFTYVDDVVNATLRAAVAATDGLPINVGGGATTTVCEVLVLLGQLLGRTPRVHFEPAPPGDMRSTHADLARATALLGYAPRIGLREGLERQITWTRPLQDEAARRATAALLSLRR